MLKREPAAVCRPARRCAVRNLALLGLLVLAAAGCGGGTTPAATGPTIGFVQLLESAQLNLGYDGFRQALSDSGYVDGKTVTIDYRCAQGDLTAVPLILDRFVQERVALIGTNTTPCMLAAAQKVRDIPVVITVTFGPRENGITTVPPNLTGYYDDCDAGPLLAVMRECLPGLTTIGIPYSSGEANAVYAAGKVREAAAAMGITVLLQPITTVNELRDATLALAGQGAQALVLVSDNAVYASIDALLPVARERQLPVFGTDPEVVRQGAAVGWGVDFYDWGYASGQVAAALLGGSAMTDVPLRPCAVQQLLVSEANARSQGMTIPAGVLARAKRLPPLP